MYSTTISLGVSFIAINRQICRSLLRLELVCKNTLSMITSMTAAAATAVPYSLCHAVCDVVKTAACPSNYEIPKSAEIE